MDRGFPAGILLSGRRRICCSWAARSPRPGWRRAAADPRSWTGSPCRCRAEAAAGRARVPRPRPRRRSPRRPRPRRSRPAPEPPPKVLKPPKEEPRKGLPELRTRRSRSRSPRSRRRHRVRGPPRPSARRSKRRPVEPAPASATPGLEISARPGPGVPGGTDAVGDWYLAGVQRKIWMIWTQQIKHAASRSRSPSRFTILADGSVEDVRSASCSPAASRCSTWRRSAPSSRRRPSARCPRTMEPTESRSRRSSSRRRRAARRRSARPLRRLVGVARGARPAAPGAHRRDRHRRRQAQRFAVPDCIPRAGDEASREACRTITQVLRNDLKFEGLFQFVPESLFAAIPPLNPDAPELRGLEVGRRQHPRRHARRGRRAASSRWRSEVYFVDGGQSMLAKRYSGRADNPRIFAHQASDDIMTLTQYRGVARTKIAFVSDRDATKEKRGEGAVHRRLRRLQPAARHRQRLAQHPARLEPGRPLPRLRLLPPGTPRASSSRRSSKGSSANLTDGRRPGLRALLQPRRQAHRVREQPQRQHGDLGRERRRHAARAASRPARPRHRALLEPDRPGDRVHLEPRRHAADLRDGQRGPERAAAHDGRQLQRRPRLEPVEAVQRDRLHRRASRAASRSPWSTWPPARSGRSPRAAGAASTRPGPPTAATSSSPASAARPGRSRSRTARAATIETLGAGAGNNVAARLGPVSAARAIANRGVMKRHSVPVVLVALVLLAGCGGTKRRPPC